MSTSKSRKKRSPKRVLALPDLEHAKTAVLNSLTSASGQRTYDHAIREFVAWYCSEPRLAFNRTVVLRYRIHLEQRKCAGHDQSSARRGPADRVRGSGRRSTESRTGGRHPSGEGRATDRCAPRELADARAGPAASGVRDAVDGARITGSRDGRDVDRVRSASRRAVGPQPRVNPATRRALGDCRSGRQGRPRAHRADSHLVKGTVDAWTAAAAISHGRVFREINKAGRVWGDGMSPKVLWDVVRAAAARAAIDKLAPHDLRRTCARLCHLAGGELDQIQFLLGHVSIQTTERYLGCKQKLRIAVNDRLGIEPDAP